jgi:hypothetical protein
MYILWSYALDADRRAMWMRWIISAGCRPVYDVDARRKIPRFCTRGDVQKPLTLIRNCSRSRSWILRVIGAEAYTAQFTQQI